jgi:hypothetical protein
VKPRLVLTGEVIPAWTENGNYPAGVFWRPLCKYGYWVIGDRVHVLKAEFPLPTMAQHSS